MHEQIAQSSSWSEKKGGTSLKRQRQKIRDMYWNSQVFFPVDETKTTSEIQK